MYTVARVLASEELAFEVDGHEPVEDGHVEGDDVCVDSVERGVGRIVVQHVETAERLDRLDHVSDALLFRDVDLDGDGCIELALNAPVRGGGPITCFG
jgi:hypothetical protein